MILWWSLPARCIPKLSLEWDGKRRQIKGLWNKSHWVFLKDLIMHHWSQWEFCHWLQWSQDFIQYFYMQTSYWGQWGFCMWKTRSDPQVLFWNYVSIETCSPRPVESLNAAQPVWFCRLRSGCKDPPQGIHNLENHGVQFPGGSMASGIWEQAITKAGLVDLWLYRSTGPSLPALKGWRQP